MEMAPARNKMGGKRGEVGDSRVCSPSLGQPPSKQTSSPGASFTSFPRVGFTLLV